MHFAQDQSAVGRNINCFDVVARDGFHQ
jgi:hypothetical protein